MRKTNLAEVKKVMAKYAESAEKGIFFTRNTVGDSVVNVYSCDGIDVDICFRYRYFEIFGLSEEEKKEIVVYYNEITKGVVN